MRLHIAETPVLGVHGMGDVADPVMANCGPNPCGFMDALWPGAACTAWQLCATQANQQAAAQTGGGVDVPCVVGGTDANGNTIINCPQQPPCVSGQGPLQEGQIRCSDLFTAYSSIPAKPSSPVSNQTLVIGLAAVLLVLAVARR